jgi:alpha-tubulin suppressor-like RCC1 family protein
MRYTTAFLLLVLTIPSRSFTPYLPELVTSGNRWIQDRPARAIAAGFSHTLVLLQDSTVFAWGRNDSGQTDVPNGLAGVVSIKAGGNTSAARTKDGRIFIWGGNSAKQCEAPDSIRNARDFVLGHGFGAALMPDSTIAWWGNHAQISQHLTNAKALRINAFGGTFSVLLASGEAQAWEGPSGTLSAHLPPTPSNPGVDIANGYKHIVVLHKDSTVSCNSTSDVQELSTCPNLTGVVSISASYRRSAALTSDGTIRTWGRASTNRFASLDLADKIRLPDDTIEQLHVGFDCIFAVTRSHSVRAWDESGGPNTILIDSSHAYDAVAIGVGLYHELVLHRNGKVTASGQYTFKNAYVPAGLSNVRKLVGGRNYSAALLGDSTVFVWGDTLSDFGTGIPECLTNVVDIAGGPEDLAALKSDGKVVIWNRGGRSIFGDSLSDIAAICHFMAVKKDGSMVSWGLPRLAPPSGNDFVTVDSKGQLYMALRKDGTVTTWSYPSTDSLFRVPANLTDVVSIAAGNRHALALKRDGSVVAWGRNSEGQTKIPKNFKARAIAAGNTDSWLLRDTASTTEFRRSAPPHQKTFESGMYLVHGMDGTLLWKGELRNLSELSRFQARSRILVLRRIPSGDVTKIVSFGRN